ncbi:MAG: VanW family protein [Clostridia bacterium]|nr:VanW family protein [Clostridia bacterium]
MVQKKRRKRRKNNKKKNLRLILSISIAFAVCVIGACVALVVTSAVPSQKDMTVVFDNGLILSGTTINGVEVSGMTPAKARVAIEEEVQKKAEEIAVKLAFSDRTEKLEAKSIGVYPNADATIAEAMKQGRRGNITQRKNEMGNPAVTALTLGYTYDENTLEDAIRASADTLDTKALEPSVVVDELSGVRVVEGKAGIVLDKEEYVKAVKEAVENGTFGPVTLPGEPLNPTYSTEDIKANTVLITSSKTIYTDSPTSGRAKNIKLMCEKLSGSVVMPGETFSVNDTAGPRNAANGWFLANGIENGVYTKQYGGGICQVSTTLYNSLLKADLQITARRPHTIPSGYCKRALDAAISTGGPDLAFTNNTDWPIYLILYTVEPEGSRQKEVYADIYGRPVENGMTIELLSVDVSITPFDPLDVVYVTDEELVRNGRNRYVSEAWKVYKDATGKEVKRVKANTSTYAGSKPYVLEPVSPSPGTGGDAGLTPGPAQ